MADKLIAAIRDQISLSSKDIEVIKELFSKKVIEKDEYLLREGEVCRQISFVEEGLLRFYVNEDGQEVIHFFAQEGDFACNFESFLKGIPSRKNIQAIEATVVWIITKANIDVFYKKIAQGEKFGRLLIEKKLLETITRFLQQYTHTSEQRYRDFLVEYPDLWQRIPQYYIASYVGVEPQSLSRIRKRLATI